MPKRFLGGALVVLVVLVVAGIVVAVMDRARSGGTHLHPLASDHHRSEARSTNPAGAGGGVPTGGWNLPRPTRYQGVVGQGFPHSTLGAVALGYSEATAQVQVSPTTAEAAVEETALHPSDGLGQQVAQGVQAMRAHYGIAPNGPTSDTISLSLDACRVQQVAPDRVVAGYEGILVVQGPTVRTMTANYSFAVPLVWSGHDWKIDSAGASLPQPPIAFPGTPRSVSDGWHPCSET